MERLIPPFLLAAALAASPVSAGEWRLVLDPSSTGITFRLGATLHSVKGAATLERGAIRFDPSRGTVSGEVVVAALSVNTDNARRDKEMHRKVLESGRFPWIVFRPERILGRVGEAGESALEIEGSLEIHGSRHGLTIVGVVTAEEDWLEFRGGFGVPYVEWGMKDPSKLLLRVEKTVEVELTARGRLFRSTDTGSGVSSPVD